MQAIYMYISIVSIFDSSTHLYINILYSLLGMSALEISASLFRFYVRAIKTRKVLNSSHKNACSIVIWTWQWIWWTKCVKKKVEKNWLVSITHKWVWFNQTATILWPSIAVRSANMATRQQATHILIPYQLGHFLLITFMKFGQWYMFSVFAAYFEPAAYTSANSMEP